MNTSFTAVLKWLVAIGTCIAAGAMAYDQVKHGPPVTNNDWWDFGMVCLKASGIGIGGKAINVGIQKANEAKGRPR